MIHMALWIISLIFLLYVGFLVLMAVIGIIGSIADSIGSPSGSPATSQPKPSVANPTHPAVQPSLQQATPQQALAAKVEERKNRARMLGVDDVLFNFWKDYFRFKNYDRFCETGHLLVDKVNAAADGGTVSFEIQGKQFLFTSKMNSTVLPDDAYFNHAKLILFSDGCCVLEVSLHEQDAKHAWESAEWYVHDITAFVEGDWVECFLSLHRAIQNFKGSRQKQSQEQSQEEAERNLRARFGL